MVVLVVGEADRIENQMVMNMSLINMGGKYKLVLATQYLAPLGMNKPLVLPGVDKKPLVNKNLRARVVMVWRPHHKTAGRFLSK